MPDVNRTHKHAGQLAQLLGETIVHHAPHTAKLNAEAAQAQAEKFMEGLERHIAGQVGPFLQHVLDHADVPDVLKPLLEEGINPSAQFSSILEQIFLYGIVSQVIGAAIQPFLVAIVNDLNTVAVSTGIVQPTPLATIATAAGRGLNKGSRPTVSVPAWAYEEAAKQGVSKEDVDLAASLVGLPPALQELLELLRRGKITLDEVKQGLREGDFRDDWIDRTVELAYSWLTPLDFIRAAVQDQMSYADAEQWAQRAGLDTSTEVPIHTEGGQATPNMFGLGFSIAGRPPGPQELAHAANRGLIEWEGRGAGSLTFEQGIAESDIKTKWTPTLRGLGKYFPPPEQVRTLLEHGGITPEQASELWRQGGVPEAITKAYSYTVEQQHVTQDKLLARHDITTAYYEHIISKQQAVELLSDLGYRGDVAGYILDITDGRRQFQAINSIVRRVTSLFVNHKISATHAKEALIGVGVDAGQADKILAEWEVLRVEPVRLPTVAEIGKAVKYGTIDEKEALFELAQLGYQPRDAAIVLSATAETVVKPLPAAGTGVTG